ncbi:MAG: Tol biopolymer transport system component [Candidatus Krumholzibacteriia bacterium]
MVTTALTSPVYTEPGYLLFQRGRKIVAQAFDTKTLAVSGETIVVNDAPEISDVVGRPAISASRTGHITFKTPEDGRTQLEWLDGTTGESLDVLDVEPDHFTEPALSPDNRHVAIVRKVSPEESDIWILELDRMVMTRFTQGAGNKASPVWSPDGEYIAYGSDADGPWNIYKKSFKSGGSAEPLVVGPAPFKNAHDWSPDGKYLLYEQLGETTNMDLWIAPTDGSEAPYVYVENDNPESSAQFSPDGRWVAYMAYDKGPNVVVNTFPVPSLPHRVSIGLGSDPQWQADGKAIGLAAFIDDKWVSARASFQAEPLRTGIPEAVFEFPEDLRDGIWAVDDRRVLALRAVGQTPEESVTVILNWVRMLED